MSAEFGLTLAVVTILSCWASYIIGQREMLARLRRNEQRRREREKRWSEFYDEDFD